MHIRCPHCQNPVEVIEDSTLTDISCPACGSSFSLIDEETETFAGQDTQTLGHFTLSGRLGAGHFGTVWMARDTELDRTVAIKIPRKEQLDATGTEQFLREARAAAQLKHPNIVSVHEVGRDGDTLYIVSDFVRGVTLSDWLTATRPTIREAAELCAKLADALHHAHEAGVVHRDLKPSNIMMDAEGEPRIMDFGLAKREAGEITMTVEGKILGTPAYMSPEQARGEGHHADRRSDVYSLGVILFELLTGERPFRGNVRMLLHQVIHDDPSSPRRFNASVPRDLETICLKCLEKNPESRYQKAADLADELRRWLDGHPIHARPVTKPERAMQWAKRNPVVASLSATIATLIVLVVVAAPVVAIRETTLRRRADEEAERAGNEARLATIAAEKEALASKSARESENRLRKQLYLADMQNAVEAKGQQDVSRVRELLQRHIPEKGQQDLRGFEWYHLWRYSHQYARSLPHRMAISAVAVTPDGTVAATAGYNSHVKLWSLVSGKRLATTPSLETGYGIGVIAFSPDGKSLIVGSSGPLDDRVRVWDWANEKLRTVIRGMPGQFEFVVCSPDGRLLAARTGTQDISLYRLEDGTLLRRLEAMGVPRAFSPDSKLLAISKGKGAEIWDVESDTRRLRFSGHKAGVTQMAYSSDGQIIASGDVSGALKLWNAVSGAEITTLLGHENVIVGLVFKDNDKTLYSASRDNAIRVWDVDTRQQRMAVSAHGRPIWSIASSKSGDVLLTGSPEFSAKVWSPATLRIDEIRTDRTDRFQPIAFTMDSKGLIVAGRYNRLEMWDLVNGRRVVSLDRQHQEVRCLAVSPDGETFVSGGADGRVVLWTLSSAVPQRATDHLGASVDSVAFYPDGLRLAIGLSKSRLVVWNLKDWREEFSNDADVRSLAISRDGQQVFAAIDHFYSWAWHGETGASLGKVTGINSEALAVSASPVDDKVVTAGEGPLTVVRDLANKSDSLLKGHTKPIRSVAFSPDGRVIASASDDGSVRLWDAESCQQRVSFPCDAPLRQVAFSPDGKVLAASTQDGVIRLFHTATAHDVTESLEQERSAGEYPPDLTINLIVRAEKVTEPEDAIRYCSEALRILAPFVKESGSRFAYSKMLQCYRLRAAAYARMGQIQKAVSDIEAYLEIYDQLGDMDDVVGRNESVAAYMNSIAREIATRPGTTPGEGRTAIRSAKQACEMTDWRNCMFLDTLAACYAAAGEFESAIEWQKKTLELTRPEDAAGCKARLALYEQGKRCIEREQESTPQAEQLDPRGTAGEHPPENRESDEQSAEKVSNDPDESPELAALASQIASADLQRANARSLEANGRLQEAIETYRKALELRERIAAELPDDPNITEDLASSCNELASLALKMGQYQEAEKAYRKAVPIREKLVAESPETPRFRAQLAWTYQGLGYVLNRLERPEEAEEVLRKAVALREGLVMEAPDTVEYQRDLAWSLNVLGEALKDLGRVKEAQDVLDRAVALWKELVSADPTDTISSGQLGVAQAQLAKLLKAVAAEEKGGPTNDEKKAE